jgi:hypothetical protein
MLQIELVAKVNIGVPGVVALGKESESNRTRSKLKLHEDVFGNRVHRQQLFQLLVAQLGVPAADPAGGNGVILVGGNRYYGLPRKARPSFSQSSVAATES